MNPSGEEPAAEDLGTGDLGLPWEPVTTPDHGLDTEHQLALFHHDPTVPETAAFASGPPRRRGRTAVALAVAGLLFLSAGIGIGWTLTRRTSTASSPTAESPLTPVPQKTDSSGRAVSGLDVQTIANKVDPAVVDINTSFDSSRFGGNGQPTAQAAGTGMVLTSSGEVLTNNHVVQGANNISVTIQGRSGRYSATVIGVDPVDDVALLQIQGVSGLPTVTLADSSQLATGQAVVAIGNALGQGGTPSVTQGTILGLDRSITVRGGATPESLSGLIQFDAPISPGDSGGPLVNTSAQVVGMITAAESTGRAQRVSYQGYAIAVNTAVHVVNQIRSGQSGGNIIIGPAGFLGVQVSDLDSTIAARLGLSVSSGALVVGVVPGTPAAGLGISRYAVINAINGRRIGSAADLGPAIHSHKPGEQIQVTWIDSSGTHTATVRLIAGPAA
jgi:S1-C subfamily serine protease